MSKPPFPRRVRAPFNSIFVLLNCLVAGRVDFSFLKTGDIGQVEIEFGLRIPEKARYRLEAAYLCQSLSFIKDCDDVRDVGEYSENPIFPP